MSVGLDGLELDFDEPEQTPGLAERAGFRSGDVATSTVSVLNELIGANRRSRGMSLSATEVAAARAATLGSAPQASAGSSSGAAAPADHGGGEEGEGHSFESGSGGGSAAGSAVSVVTDMGEQAHVGGTGVVSAASEDNLEVDDASDDEVEQAAQATRAEEARRAEESAEAAQPLEAAQAAEPEPVEHGDEDEFGEPEDTAPAVQRVRVGQGAPDLDATYQPKIGFSFGFGDGSTAQVKKFPNELVSRLRADLESVTTPDFARQMDLSGMVTAFVAVQLGMVPDARAAEATDANTLTAMRAFAQLDRRTAALEATLATVESQVHGTDDRVRGLVGTFTKTVETLRVLENAVTYLVSERLDPSSMVGTLPSEVAVMGGKYATMRDRLRLETSTEIRDEKLRHGRRIP